MSDSEAFLLSMYILFSITYCVLLIAKAWSDGKHQTMDITTLHFIFIVLFPMSLVILFFIYVWRHDYLSRTIWKV